MQTGTNIASIISKDKAATSTAAACRGILSDNLSTIGLREHAITKDAKNNIAMSLQLNTKNKNNYYGYQKVHNK